MTAKEKIVTTFFDLLNIKSFDQITISELCIASNVHRTTFYLYFDNLYDLLIESMDEAKSKFSSYFLRQNKEENHLTHDYLVPYLQFIKDNKNLFLAYLNNNQLFDVEKSFDHIFNSIVLPKSGDNDPQLMKYITLFYMGGIIHIIEEWIRNDFKEDVEEVSKIILMCINLDFNNK